MNLDLISENINGENDVCSPLSVSRPSDLERNPPYKNNSILSSNIALNTTSDVYGYGSDEYNKSAEYDAYLNPWNSEEELNLERAKNQSALEQTGNFLMQAGVGEIFLGTLEGLGNVFDGVANMLTDETWGESDWSRYFREARENLRDNYEIYQENPNATFQLADWGWWMNNAVSVASTLSLMLPAAGWAKALGTVGRLSGLNRLTRTLGSRALMFNKAGRTATAAGETARLRQLAVNEAKLRRFGNKYGNPALQAAISRTGENQMEAKAVYNDVYASSLENLENMPDEEYAKFLDLNPEFQGMSKDMIAQEIARKSASKTFYNDFFMLAMDIPQFTALGSLFNRASRAATASERIAAENVRRSLAGMKAEDLIKDNIINRTKNSIQYALKNPKNSFAALELGEGFEEIYQGIQSEKGLEVATKYFDPSFTPRTLGSYLSDPEIWEQGFWGALGGIAFNKAYRGVQELANKAKGAYNKKHMTAEQFERWKQTENKIRIADMQSIIANAQKFSDEMRTLSQNKNPYNFYKDKTTGAEIIVDGDLVNQTIDDEQRKLLEEVAIDRFIKQTTFDAVDNGTFDMMAEIIGSNAFDTFMQSNGISSTVADKAMSQQVVERMNQIRDMYQVELDNFDKLDSNNNPFIVKAAAREVVNSKLRQYDNETISANLAQKLAELNDTNTDYNGYIEQQRINYFTKLISKWRNIRNTITQQYNNKEISKAAYEEQTEYINRYIRSMLDYLAENTISGSFDSIKEQLDKTIGLSPDMLKAFDEIAAANNQQVTVPPDSIKEVINQQLDIDSRMIYEDNNVPKSEDEYYSMYDEFALSMDKYTINKINDSIDKIREYVRNAEDFDDAIQRVTIGNTGNKQLDEILAFLKYGYTLDNASPRGLGQKLINLNFAGMLQSLKAEKTKADKMNEEANNKGVHIPTKEEENNGVEEAATDGNPPSTGEREGTKPAEPARPTRPVESANDSSVGVVEEDEDSYEPASDTPIDKEEDDTALTQQQLAEQAALADAYATDNLKAQLDAGKYVVQISFKEQGRIEAINNALQQGDRSKYDEFINELTKFLIKQGYSKELSEIVAKKSFANSIASIAAMGKDDVFTKLSKQLALGFGEESAKKMSTTELLDGKGVDEIVDKFLDEFNKTYGNIQTSDGKYVINLQEVFDILLNDKKIDILTAKYIYDNINNYISRNTDGKYIFTGYTVNGKTLSSYDFFNILNENKRSVALSVNQMHISLVDPQYRNKLYDRAILAAAQGSKVTGELEYDKKGNLSNIGLYVFVEYKREKHKVKIGILRTVNASANGNSYNPTTHRSYFRNEATKNANGSYSLSSDWFFNELLNMQSNPAKELMNIITTYEAALTDIKNKNLTGDKLQKALRNLLPDSIIESMKNNELVRRLINSEEYKFDVDDRTGYEIYTRKNMAKLISDISNILFYGKWSNTYDAINDNSAISLTKRRMKLNLDSWRAGVYTNYSQTYSLQNAIDNNLNGDIVINVPYNISLNYKENPEEYDNIADIGFNVDPNNSTPTMPYNPLIMVCNGKIVDENGNDYGLAPTRIGDYHMGFLVYNDEYTAQAAYFYENELKGSELDKLLREELRQQIIRQFENISDGDHSKVFNDIKQRLFELFGPKGLFKFEGISIVGDVNNRWFAIQRNTTDETGKIVPRNILTFHSKNSDGVTNSHAIGFGDIKTRKTRYVNSINGNSRMSEIEVSNAIAESIDEIFKSVKLNKSTVGFTGKNADGSNPTIFNKSKDGFDLNIGGQNLHYANYADFILSNRGFKTDVYKSGNSFTKRYINNSGVTAKFKLYSGQAVQSDTNTDVSDYLYTDKRPKRITVDTRDILELAGVSQDEINAMLIEVNGIPVVMKRIYTDNTGNESDYAYYSIDKNQVVITVKGAIAMNANPANAKRLILHENIHRLFNQKRVYNENERNRILNDLEEVYNYTTKQLDDDLQNGVITQQFYNSIIDTLNTATSSKNRQVAMEEFLVECFTQPVLAQYLNDREYNGGADISNINKKKKSIFQKIIDIILDLLGISTNRIKNNSILAKAYLILSNNNNIANNTNIDNAANSADLANTHLPVEGRDDKAATNTSLEEAKKTIEEANTTLQEETAETEISEEDTSSEDYADADVTFDDSLYIDADDLIDDTRFASTDIINPKENISSAEIYAPLIADNITADSFGVKIVNDMNEFINVFPSQYRQNIRQILDSNELNYTCQ